VLDRREVVVPLNKVAAFGDEVRLVLSASELAGVDLYDSHALRPMPDHWPMPAGFDLRSFFLVPDAWTASALPFVLTSPSASGVPAYIPDADAVEAAPVREPAIARGTPVYDNAGEHLGDVEGVDLDPASRRITRVRVRKGRLFPAETAIPADVIASVDDDRITLRVRADVVKTLRPVERSATSPGPSDTLPVRP
jgi:sporulation protein YlmC with PRC-barrel domain